MMRQLDHLLRDVRASSAAEIALALPLLLILVFAPLELGYYFMSEHLVAKSVRDAARYAARLPSSNFDCSTGTIDALAEQQIQRVAKAGVPNGDWNDDGNQDQRLAGWTSDDDVNVTLACDSDSGHAYVGKGIYTDFPDGVPVVTVSASIEHPTLVGILGFGKLNLTLNASSQATVFGT